MRKWVWIGLAVLMVIALGIGGGTALANRYTDKVVIQETTQQWGGYLDNATLNRVAVVLGLTPAELTTQLQSGKTLAQLAKDKNVTSDKVVDAILAPHKDQLQLRVKYGYITQTQSDSYLATAKQQAEITLNRTFNTSGVTGGPNTPGYSANDMLSDCNNMMGSGGMGSMMGSNGGMMGGGGGMMSGGGGMMGNYGSGRNTPRGSNSFGSGGRGMMGGNSGGMMGGGMMGGWN